MTFSKPIQRLFNLGKKSDVKLGLETMIRLDRALSSPSLAFPSIIVAGTNGKGSITTKVATSIALAGKKVGLYTSPHIATLRERIQINGEMISEENVNRLLDKLFQVIDENKIEASFFEAMTALGFLYFAEQKVDLAVLEVGMGGRLDATNIATPLLSIITSIDWDHTRYLGETLEAIAFEKAGIIKPKIPVLVGPRAKLFPVFREVALEKQSPYFEVEVMKEYNFEEENRLVAASALNHLHFPYDVKGLLTTPPCRFECVQKEIPVLLDVAHNPGAFRALFDRIKVSFPEKKIVALLALSSDKEIDPSLTVLQEHVSSFVLTQGETERAENPSHLASKLSQRGFLSILVEPDITLAMEKARKMAFEKEALLVVTGTFYIMAKVRRALGIIEPRDPVLSKY